MENKKLQSTKTWLILLSGLLVIILVRILPAIGQPLYAYGYDYGFYRYAAQHLAPLSLHTVFTGISGGYNNSLFYIFNFLGLPVDASLTASHFLFAVLLGLAIFCFLKKYGLLTAWFGTLLTAFSLVQLESYTMFLWKTGLALPLFVWGLKCARNKNYLQLLIVILLLLITHRTSAIFFLLSIGAHLLVTQIQTKQWKLLALEGSLLGISIAIFWTRLINLWNNTFTSTDQYFVRDGIFFYGQNKLLIVWPLLLLAAYGLYRFYKDKQSLLVPLLGLTTLVWMLMRLPFYNRMLIYFDLALICLGAYALAILFHRYKSNMVITGVLCVFIIFIGYRGAHAALTKPPLITKTELEELKNFKTNTQVPFVLATSANDAPWLLGFLQNSRLGAPGLFEDTHLEREWQTFWQGQHMEEFLSSFPQPLYLYHRSFPINLTDCLIPVSPHFTHFICSP